MARVIVQDLSYTYPGTESFSMAIRHLEIDPGSCLAVVGPSGSGKTTLLALMAGMLLPQAGHIEVGGRELHRMNDGARRRYRMLEIGQVFQTFELLDYLDVLNNVLLSRIIASRPDAQARSRALELLDSVGLADKARRRPSKLSQGERQRVAVCRAMLNAPGLILADEPTGNLDQQNKQKVVELLIDQSRKAGSTLVMVTHDASLLDAFDRVLDVESLGGPGS